MCSGHACRMLWIVLEDQRRDGGMLLECLGALGGFCEVSCGPLSVSWEVLGRPWRPWERLGNVLGGPWGATQCQAKQC